MIERLDPIYAEFTISQNDLTNVQQQMRAGTLKTEVRLPDTNEMVAGQLTFLDNSVQNQTGQVSLRYHSHSDAVFGLAFCKYSSGAEHDS